MHKGSCTRSKIGNILLVIGGINWGLIGLGMLLGKGGSWNVVNMLLGSMSWLEAVIYILVGVAGVVMIFGCKCNKCVSACNSCAMPNKGGMDMGGNKMM